MTKYLLMKGGLFWSSTEKAFVVPRRRDATSFSERDFAMREVTNRFSRTVWPLISIVEVPDWTMKPLGTARPLLRARAAILVATLCDGVETNFALNVSATPQMIEAMCDDLEEAIAAFRDNER